VERRSEDTVSEDIRPPATEALAPFRVRVPQRSLDDLRERLRRTRWPEAATEAGWAQGVPLSAARRLVEYWRDAYDWRPFEERLNGLPQYRTRIDGLGFHVVHVRSPHPGAMPLLLTHGWPGSIVEFMETVGPLTDPPAYGGSPDDAFDVVMPSLPGFGFSDKPAERGWAVPRVARAWAELMARLGYARWAAQGGDWGAAVTHVLAKLRPDGLIATHVNWPMVFPAEVPANPTAEEHVALNAREEFRGPGGAYWRMQSTRPQTLGYGLADSPVAQAMWIYEKFHAWTDNDGQPEQALPLDSMLDNITLYWLTNTAASSARFYLENSPHGPSFSLGPVETPMAITTFPREIVNALRSWAERDVRNLIFWHEAGRGGHFAAFEEPDLFVNEVRAAFRPMRQP
jgi:pimeloyl-ACP methyl ester carboxylesterase